MYLCLIFRSHSRYIQRIVIRDLFSDAHIRGLILLRNAQHRKINTALQPDPFLCDLPVVDRNISFAVKYLQYRDTDIRLPVIRYLGLARDPRKQLTHICIPCVRDDFFRHPVDIS